MYAWHCRLLNARIMEKTLPTVVWKLPIQACWWSCRRCCSSNIWYCAYRMMDVLSSIWMVFLMINFLFVCVSFIWLEWFISVLTNYTGSDRHFCRKTNLIFPSSAVIGISMCVKLLWLWRKIGHWMLLIQLSTSVRSEIYTNARALAQISKSSILTDICLLCLFIFSYHSSFVI